MEATFTETKGQERGDPESLEKVLAYTQKIDCPAGETLIDTGSAADRFYYVAEGLFEVSYMAGKTPIVVAVIGSGAFIGEIGFFDRQTRTRTIRAVEDARLHVVDRQVMHALQMNEPQVYGWFLEFVLGSVCSRFRQILSDRGPLSAYAADLSTGRQHFRGIQPVPGDVMGASVWQETSRRLEEFKAGMFDVAYRLQQQPGDDLPEALREQGESSLDEINQTLRQVGPDIDANDSADLIWGYLFKEVFPYLMRSRLAERAYYKPKGYAGDFYMIELIYRNRPEGDGKLGRLVDGWALQQVASKAVRYRRRLLADVLDRLCRDRLDTQAPVRIMNLACGPSRELFDLLGACSYARRIEAVCMDIDDEALQFADRCVASAEHRRQVRFMKENVIKWSLGRIRHDFQPQDIIYSSGLCDYLDQRLLSALIQRAYRQLKDGGALVIGNFSPDNPDRYLMDQLLYWRLIHRSRDDLLRIFADSPFGSSVDIVAEGQGVNLFAIARR